MFAPWKCEMAGPKEWMPAPLPLHSKHYVMKRLILLWAALVLAAVSLAQTSTWGLMQLPYATDALTPVITRRTVELHHGKHLAAYAATLQRLVEGTEYERKSLEYIVRHSTGVIFNNAGQVLNHNLYFEQFSPTGGGLPTGRLAQAFEAQWGSFENFCEEFEKRGTALFGSGWCGWRKMPTAHSSFCKSPAVATPLLPADAPSWALMCGNMLTISIMKIAVPNICTACGASLIGKWWAKDFDSLF